ncbi:MAG: hypothetical protein NC548_38975 [Lachnospiraceae bacterium]|nr:hypothetical protein [Lachnospiraceae bacterium]
MKSIRELVFKLEGYGEIPDYEIESITNLANERIQIVVRMPQTETKKEAENAGN